VSSERVERTNGSEAWTASAPGWRKVAVFGLLAAVAVGLLYVLVPALAGLDDTWDRLATGEPGWLAAALAFEVLSYASYMALLRMVFDDSSPPLSWLASYRITMAGVVASRLLALAGAGGIVVTAWALHRLGVSGREVAVRLAGFFILLYSIFMLALVLGGLGLMTGVLGGAAPVGLTLIPAAFAAGVILVVLAIGARSPGLDAVLDGPAGTSRVARAMKATAATRATVASGLREALTLVRSRRPGLLGALGWWAFDIAVLWACLEAFGDAPPAATITIAYFVGQLANTLPIPGGVGAVEGGMIAALVGFGVASGLAIVAVLSYRAFAFWLPMVPGVVAYLQLVRMPPAVTAAEAP
jgi:uncharacterized protein (TIRG00374 family)